MNFKSLILIFLGSGLGGCLRWYVGYLIGTTHVSAFPWATFLVNLLACGIAGFAGAWGSSKVDTVNMSLFWLVGFCGGFSTMSAFSREWLQLLQNGSTSNQVLYPSATLVACVLSTYTGAWIYSKI